MIPARKAALVLLLCAATAGTDASAQQYKWKDERGRTQYGDSPPAGVRATPLRPPPAAPVSASKGGGNAAQLDAEFRKRRQAERESASKAESQARAAKAKSTNCATARERLAVLESGRRITRETPQGERYYPDDTQRAAEAAAARKVISADCS